MMGLDVLLKSPSLWTRWQIIKKKKKKKRKKHKRYFFLRSFQKKKKNVSKRIASVCLRFMFTHIILYIFYISRFRHVLRKISWRTYVYIYTREIVPVGPKSFIYILENLNPYTTVVVVVPEGSLSFPTIFEIIPEP